MELHGAGVGQAWGRRGAGMVHHGEAGGSHRVRPSRQEVVNKELTISSQTLLLFVCLFIYLLTYLAALGLSCGMWDLCYGARASL